MKRKTRNIYTDAQKAEMWSRWQKGDSMHDIARSFDRYHSSIQRLLTENGGIRPRQRKRSPLALTLEEREIISRGLAQQLSQRAIATQLGRSPLPRARALTAPGDRGQRDLAPHDPLFTAAYSGAYQMGEL